jgi:NhaP-type Na+/H+ or K+/H+ antiporter
VARIFAGILGPLAFLTSLAHGMLHARSTETILLDAWCALVGFAALGCVIGWIAGRTVDEEVRRRVALSQAVPETVPPPSG